MNQHNKTFGSFAQDTRERRLRRIRSEIRGGSYETAAKLDAAVERMIDAEGFSSHPPVLRSDDAAVQEWMDEQMQGLCESDRLIMEVISRERNIYNVPISSRARRVLRDMNVRCLRNLGNITERDLRCAKNCGPSTIAEIKELANSAGVSIGGNESPEQRPSPLRQQYAMAALTGLLSSPSTEGDRWENIAEAAFKAADAMLAHEANERKA